MERYLTAEQVSAIVGYSIKTLANLRSQKRGPTAYKNGKTIRYKESDIKEWMEQNFSPVEMVNDKKVMVRNPRSERR